MHHAAFERGQRRLPGKAGHLHIAKAVVGEARLINFRAFALEGVDIGRLRGAQVVEVKRAIGLQRFGMAKRDLRARGPATRSGGTSRPCSGPYRRYKRRAAAREPQSV